MHIPFNAQPNDRPKSHITKEKTEITHNTKSRQKEQNRRVKKINNHSKEAERKKQTPKP